MTIDLAQLPRQVSVAAGEPVTFLLPSYADSGNTWSAACVSAPEIAHVAVELAAPTPLAHGDGTAAPPELTLLPEVAVVQGRELGTAVWRVVLARSFGVDPPAATHEFEVIVV